MYLSILDYRDGKVIINIIPDDIDAEEYVSDLYGLDNVSYMTTKVLSVDIQVEPEGY
jgi:hypothetical protein